MCMGSSAPPPPPPPPPPQPAKMPDAINVRNDTANGNVAQGGGAPTTTLLTGAQGQPVDPNTLAKKTLLGQ